MATESNFVEIEGIDEFLNALNALDDKVLVQILGTAMRKNLNENVVKPVRAALPYSRKTKAGIKVQAMKRRKLAYRAGITRPIYYLRFVEKGTEQRTTKAGWNRGKINPRPIAIPIMQQAGPKIVDYFANDFKKEVERVVEQKLKKITKK